LPAVAASVSTLVVFLERGCRNEALGAQRSLGDAEQQGLGRCRPLLLGLQVLIDLLEQGLFDMLAHQEFGVAGIGDADR